MLERYSFVQDGFQARPGFFPPELCVWLHKDVLGRRYWRDIFLSEEDYREAPQKLGNNPRPGRNLAEKMSTYPILGDHSFHEEMTTVCGPRWRVLDYKFVMGYPTSWLPEWIQIELGDRPMANLGEFVVPGYRDLTYFRGIDFHQDIVDFPSRPADFITAYVYLDDVGEDASPLHVVPGSHCFGATVFPHTVIPYGSHVVYACDPPSVREAALPLEKLTAPAGTLFYWHPFILHGTRPHGDERPRISLRILIDRNNRNPGGCLLDQLNRTIDGPMSLERTQVDIDEKGNVVRDGNIINRIS